MSTGTRAASTGARLRAGLVDPTTYRTSLHLITDFALGTLTFSVMVTLLALAGGLLVTLVGIPLLLVTLHAARGIASFERRRAAAVLGVQFEAAPVHRGRRLWDRLVDPADWRAVLYALLLFPVGVVAGTVTVAGWATAAAAITSPVYAGGLGGPAPHLGRLDLDGPVVAVVTVLLGVGLLFLMPVAVRALARLDALLVRRLLG